MRKRLGIQTTQASCKVARNFFGLLPNAEWNTLSRALWIFTWNILKHNIAEFRGLWGSICSNHCVLWTTFQNQFFWAIFKCGVKDFQQSAMNLCLEHIEAQHSWISWLLGKYFLKSLCALDYFSKSKFLWAISKCGVKYFEQSAMDLCLECIYWSTT